LKKISSGNLKSMICIQKDISNKPGIIVDDLCASTSHASDIEIKSLFIKPIDVAFCLPKYINNKNTTRNSTNPCTIGLY